MPISRHHWVPSLHCLGMEEMVCEPEWSVVVKKVEVVVVV